MDNNNTGVDINTQGAGTSVEGQTPQAQEVVVVKAGGSEGTKQVSEGLFTQEQLNTIISARINPLNAKIAELNKQIADAKAEASSYASELTGMKQQATAKKLGIPDAYIEFAIFNANKSVSKDKSFEVALTEFVTANKEMLGIKEEQGGTSTGIQQQGKNPQIAGQKAGITLSSNSTASGNNSVESSVEAFLKARGLKK